MVVRELSSVVASGVPISSTFPSQISLAELDDCEACCKVALEGHTSRNLDAASDGGLSRRNRACIYPTARLGMGNGADAGQPLHDLQLQQCSKS